MWVTRYDLGHSATDTTYDLGYGECNCFAVVCSAHVFGPASSRPQGSSRRACHISPPCPHHVRRGQVLVGPWTCARQPGECWPVCASKRSLACILHTACMCVYVVLPTSRSATNTQCTGYRCGCVCGYQQDDLVRPRLRLRRRNLGAPELQIRMKGQQKCCGFAMLRCLAHRAVRSCVLHAVAYLSSTARRHSNQRRSRWSPSRHQHVVSARGVTSCRVRASSRASRPAASAFQLVDKPHWYIVF